MIVAPRGASEIRNGVEGRNQLLAYPPVIANAGVIRVSVLAFSFAFLTHLDLLYLESGSVCRSKYGYGVLLSK